MKKINIGTGGRTRTGTVFPPGDFESPASTISPLRQHISCCLSTRWHCIIHKPIGYATNV